MSDLETTYGRQKKPLPRWFWWAVAAVGVTIGVVWIAWVAASQDRPWQTQVFGYDVIDDTTTTITLRVWRDEPIGLKCTVFAQAEDKVIVGETTLEIPADAPDPAKVKTTIRTQYRATTAMVKDCHVTS